MEIHESVEIAALPQKVWPLLVEPEHILRWCTTFRVFEYRGEQRAGPGTCFYVEEQAVGPLTKLRFEVTEWSEPHVLAFRITSGIGLKRYEQRWTLEATLLGSHFSMSKLITLPYGVLGRPWEIRAQGRSERLVREKLAKLRRMAEAE